jgi:dipeptidyl aminopeptidase/acylaminoacyl peptidase
MTPAARTIATLFVFAVGCWAISTHAEEEIPGLTVQGEKFTYDDGQLKFTGLLQKPAGKGPFPALLISHGLGGSAERFGGPKCREFVKRGFVCLAPEYTHSNPRGDRKDFGSSTENLARAKKSLDILVAQPEVDNKRLYAYGNSMGAFLTIGLAAEEPRLAAAAITAGGINPVAGYAAPSVDQAAKIKTPFCILHGTKDTTVPPERSELLATTLKKNEIPHERHTFDGIGHDLHNSQAKAVNDHLEKWFQKYSEPPKANPKEEISKKSVAK